MQGEDSLSREISADTVGHLSLGPSSAQSRQVLSPETHVSSKPLVSFVVVSRNDNHGGDLNTRTQAFISALVTQLERNEIESELIFVEWNPPADRPPLRTEYNWGDERRYCSVRVITVPNEIHNQFRYAKSLPLYQMVGKNVGIRRASGRFVVATNIDIIFGNEFFDFLKGGPKSEVLYGANRIDVDKSLPYDKPLDLQLQWCRENTIRVHTRFGTKNIASGEYALIYENSSVYREGAALLVAAAKQLASSLVKDTTTHIGHRFRLLNSRIHYPQHWSRRIVNSRRHNAEEWQAAMLHYREVKKGFAEFLSVDRRNAALRFEALANHYRYRLRQCFRPQNRLKLLTNACGDFTMLDRDSWHRLHGYSEYDGFSFHLDGLLVFSAHAAGIRQRVLDVPIYHIEHAAGSGFTPEHQESLWHRIQERGIPYLGWEELQSLIDQILKREIDYRLSSADWGMRHIDLPELRV